MPAQLNRPIAKGGGCGQLEKNLVEKVCNLAMGNRQKMPVPRPPPLDEDARAVLAAGIMGAVAVILSIYVLVRLPLLAPPLYILDHEPPILASFQNSFPPTLGTLVVPVPAAIAAGPAVTCARVCNTPALLQPWTEVSAWRGGSSVETFATHVGNLCTCKEDPKMPFNTVAPAGFGSGLIPPGP